MPAPAQADTPVVRVTHGTIKIRPTDPPPAGTAATLTAARNEFEPFQIVVTGGTTGVTGVAATAAALGGPGGATIAAQNVRLYREAYMNVTTPSNIDGATGEWPDALVPAVDELYGETRNAFPFDVPAGENRVIWVDVYVPKGSAPGDYTGTVTVTGGGLGTVPVPVALTVYPFTLPSTASLRSTFGMGWDDACVQEVGSYSACGDAGVVASHLRYATFGLDHRITLDTVYTGPAATGTGYDWATWDATYGPLLDGTAATILPGAAETTVRYEWKSDSAHYAAWASHFRARGWFDRTYDYTCDEPPAGCAWSAIPTLAAVVHGGDPAFPVLVTTNIADATANGVLSSIDLMVPIVNSMWDKGGADTRPSYDAWLAGGGKQLFMYQSCMSDGCGTVGGSYFTGWPSYMIDAPATLNRSMEWSSYAERVQGELYYATTFAYGGDPWSSQYYFGGNGDGTLLYPGTAAHIGGTDPVPVASIRLKMIREGMEDYEYLKLLTDMGDGADAMAIARTVVPNTYTVADAATLLAARAQLAADIEARLPAACGSGGAVDAGGGGGGTSGAVDASGGGAGARDAGASATGTDAAVHRGVSLEDCSPSGGPGAGVHGGCSAAGRAPMRPGAALLAGLLCGFAGFGCRRRRWRRRGQRR